jgi:signal transduction histidine kinase
MPLARAIIVVMAKKLTQLKLVHKELILVSIPLLFGFIFILIVEQQMQCYREVRDQALQTIRVSAQIYRLTSQFYALEDSLRKTQAANSSSLIDPLDSDVQAVLSLIKKDFKPTGSEKMLDAIKSDWLATKKYLEKGNVEDAQESLRELRQQLNLLGHNELLQNAPDYNAAHNLDRFYHVLLGLAIAVNVALCPMIVLYFSQSLSRRLSILIENSHRFAMGQALLPAVASDDEVGQLDDVFRSMTRAIDSAEQAKKDFVSMIGHDLRTPLNSLQATITLLRDGVYGPVTPEAQEKLKVAEETAQQLTELVTQLIDLERLKSGKLEIEFRPVNVQSLFDKSISTVTGFAQFKDISIDAPATDVSVLGDEQRLQQVMINLLGNAIKFTPDHGKVSVSASAVKNGQVEIRVSDSGCGIAPELRESVFDRFSQGNNGNDSQQSGSGLGLAICKQVIDHHFGAIGVESENGHGSTFWFRLNQVSPSSESTVGNSVKQ